MLILVSVLLVCASARAEPDAETRAAAQVLFEEGRRLRDQDRCDLAVDKLAESHRLDPAVGTLLNLADCFRNLGKSASAWLHYVEAGTMARTRSDARREAYARRAARELEPKLVRLVIDVDEPAPADLSIERDGKRIDRAQWGSAVPVDPGAHRVVASAPRHRSWETTVTLSTPGEQARVRVPTLAVIPEARVSPDPRRHEAPPAPSSGPGTMSIVGWSIGAVGVVGVGIGIGFAVRSRLLFDASLEYCPDDPDVCLPPGAELRDEARTNELVAIVALATGGAALATGIVLLITGQTQRIRPTRTGVALDW